MPMGKRGVDVRLRSLVVPQAQRMPLKRKVSLDACSVLQLPSSKPSGFESCECRMVLSEILVLRLLSSHLRVCLSSQLFTAEGICHIHKGLTRYPPCRHLWFGVEQLCPQCLGHSSVALCLIHTFTVHSHPSFQIEEQIFILCTNGNTIRKKSQVPRQFLTVLGLNQLKGFKDCH